MTKSDRRLRLKAKVAEIWCVGRFLKSRGGTSLAFFDSADFGGVMAKNGKILKGPNLVFWP